VGISLTEPKLQILRLLSEDPSHGYVISNELGRHGSTVYEHLHELEEEGYIEGEEDGRRIVYSLNEKSELILKADSMDD
jgi:DNA-binding PadR family transcriptional regulator